MTPEYAVSMVLCRSRIGEHGPVVEFSSLIKFIRADDGEDAAQQVIDFHMDEEAADGWAVMNWETARLQEAAP